MELQMGCPSPNTEKATHYNLTWRYHIAIARTEKRKLVPKVGTFLSGLPARHILVQLIICNSSAQSKVPGGPCAHRTEHNCLGMVWFPDWSMHPAVLAYSGVCMCTVLGRFQVQIHFVSFKGFAHRTRWSASILISSSFDAWPGEAPDEIFWFCSLNLWLKSIAILLKDGDNKRHS